MGEVSLEMLPKSSTEIMFLKLHLYLSGANELKYALYLSYMSLMLSCQVLIGVFKTF